MKSYISSLGAAVLFVSAHDAAAAVILTDNFDSYATQAEFEAAWPVVTAPSGTLSTAQAVTPPNSVRYEANTTNIQRNGRSFTETELPTTDQPIAFSINFFDSDAAASPYRQFANLQDGTVASSSGQLISLGLNNNRSLTDDGGNFYMARIVGYTPPELGASGAFFKLNDPGAPLRSTGWHNLRVEITDTNFRFFVDGVLSETVANTFTLRSYDIVRLGSGLSSTRAVQFDNVRVETIPEPSTLTVGLFGALALLWRRRSK